MNSIDAQTRCHVMYNFSTIEQHGARVVIAVYWNNPCVCISKLRVVVVMGISVFIFAYKTLYFINFHNFFTVGMLYNNILQKNTNCTGCNSIALVRIRTFLLLINYV